VLPSRSSTPTSRPHYKPDRTQHRAEPF
jgi:hypothetical protein